MGRSWRQVTVVDLKRGESVLLTTDGAPPENVHAVPVNPMGELNAYGLHGAAAERSISRTGQTVRQAKDGSFQLGAAYAILKDGPKMEQKGKEPNIGFWTSAKGTAAWKLDVQKPGRYAITIRAAATGGGNQLAIAVGDKHVEWARQSTGAWETFKDFDAGTIELSKGTLLLTVRSADGKAPMLNMVRLVLKPVAEAAGESGRPNIVLVLADDLGWNSLGCFGSDYYESPNIDKLAAQGMRFDNGYAACPICAPTRASLMSGWEMPRPASLSAPSTGTTPTTVSPVAPAWPYGRAIGNTASSSRTRKRNSTILLRTSAKSGTLWPRNRRGRSECAQS